MVLFSALLECSVSTALKHCKSRDIWTTAAGCFSHPSIHLSIYSIHSFLAPPHPLHPPPPPSECKECPGSEIRGRSTVT
ncbi:hypothetical protein F4778DRAFT_251898 [Xylariomycetidae sp. FL2044]|nr:hypothetical protein F4778DRAFT_251898 [Xylariomycetidae sp. FL2044]